MARCMCRWWVLAGSSGWAVTGSADRRARVTITRGRVLEDQGLPWGWLSKAASSIPQAHCPPAERASQVYTVSFFHSDLKIMFIFFNRTFHRHSTPLDIFHGNLDSSRIYFFIVFRLSFLVVSVFLIYSFLVYVWYRVSIPSEIC